MHYGEAPSTRPTPVVEYLLENTPRQIVLRNYRKLWRRVTRPGEPASALYERTNFVPWNFDKASRLGFEDGALHFIFSEHFFEHLFFDEAMALFSECHRVLAPGGVIRTVVPDADLRRDEDPEPLGFPSRLLPWDHPAKHKTRWSVYLLCEALRLAGFEPVPLRYWDSAGRLTEKEPSSLRDTYAGTPEPELWRDLSFLRRPKSLIVDGIKRAG
ncbi:methyltransferase domain-containing protein [Polyangium spumosum]|uniref:Methyltransferase domain-containing protein n=2 Tax=Polyangium spumosum TaxID=889282 RepID=A0A6N7PEM3_9BACT|nr:methyltransferase domain-containing protein [Polyangium spumosum]